MQCELAGEVKALCDRMWRDLSGLKPFGLWLRCPALKDGIIDGLIVVLFSAPKDRVNDVCRYDDCVFIQNANFKVESTPKSPQILIFIPFNSFP